MTRKEAIEELKRAIEQSCARCIRRNTRGWCEEYCAKPEALDMAIKALEQAPTIWYIAYKARVDGYSEDIVWCVEHIGTMSETINWLYGEEDIIKIVDMHEVKKGETK